MELLHEKRRSTLFNVVYRPPYGKIDPFEKLLKILFNKNKNSNKNYHVAGDFNLNLLDHEKNKKVQDFLQLMYQNGMIPTINKPTRVTKTTATTIDHIITNSSVENNFKTAMIKLDVSGHFSICIFSPSTKLFTKMMLSVNIKESLMMKRLKLFSKISINMIGILLKLIRIQMKLTSSIAIEVSKPFFLFLRTETQQKYNKKTTKTQQKHNRNTTETQQKHNNAVKAFLLFAAASVLL